MSTPEPDEIPVHVEEVTEPSPDLVSAIGELAGVLSRATREPSIEDLREVCGAPGTHLLVARDESGDPVGMLTLTHYRVVTGVRATIHDVAVAPRVRGRRVAPKLVTKAVDLAREAQAGDVEIIVPPASRSAHNMVISVGFRRDYEDTYRRRLD